MDTSKFHNLKLNLDNNYGVVYGIAYPIGVEDGGVPEDIDFDGFDSEAERDENFLGWNANQYKAMMVLELPSNDS